LSGASSLDSRGSGAWGDVGSLRSVGIEEIPIDELAWVCEDENGGSQPDSKEAEETTKRNDGWRNERKANGRDNPRDEEKRQQETAVADKHPVKRKGKRGVAEVGEGRGPDASSKSDSDDESVERQQPAERNETATITKNRRRDLKRAAPTSVVNLGIGG